MKVTAVGTGTNLVTPNRYGSSYLVETDDKKLLLDIGIHSSLRLKELGLTLADIDFLIISHRHPDHIGDLISNLISVHQAGLRGLIPERKAPFEIHGYPGLKADFDTLMQLFYPDRAITYPLSVHEHGDDEFDLSGVKVMTKLVPHMEQFMKAIAVRLEAEGQVVMYSGDSGLSENLVELATNADIAIIEASFSTKQYAEKGLVPGHMAPQEGAQIAAKAGVKKLVFSHLYDGAETDEVITDSARKLFQGEIIIAQDKLRLL
ncbi:MAG TPA: MBL fold metallo-hydrolase [Candidatus Saccharimonadales bacterium]|nr:MBL fold metallo-hydrolase [Candidatus Saccharimonadales bacterium]